MKNLLVSLSDIHYQTNGAPEDQGVVIDAFVDDVVAQVAKEEHDDVFVLIGGDLVQSGETEDYNAFDRNVIRPLMKGLNIDANHILTVPGNHDLKRDTIQLLYDEHHNIVKTRHGEKAFNDIIREPEKKDLLFSKFYPYFQLWLKSSIRIYKV